MDFSSAPIAVLDADDLSFVGETDGLDQPCEGLIKRCSSDPFDISGGLKLEASLEHLIWTFDDNISRGLLDSPDSNPSKDFREREKRNVSLDAIK